MKLIDILEPTAVLADVVGSTPRRVLSEICGPLAERTGLDRRDMVEALLSRERLGSTALGGAVAVPHANMVGLGRIIAGLGRSRVGIRFKAPEGQRIRIFLALFAPENARGEQLQALSHVSRLFQRQDLCQRLVDAKDSAELYELLTAGDAR